MGGGDGGLKGGMTGGWAALTFGLGAGMFQGGLAGAGYSGIQAGGVRIGRRVGGWGLLR